MNINESSIVSLAPNAAAAKNGHALYAKNKFSQMQISPDQDLIWAECAGSGKNPYYCSADYIDEHNPVFRCTCPSRQFPCKHALGLLYLYSNAPTQFVEHPVPDDIAAKRGKMEMRAEKKKADAASAKSADKPKKINATTVRKRIDQQLLGLDIADTLLNSIVHSGLAALDGQLIDAYQAQIKELGNYNINGIQTAFNHLIVAITHIEADDYTIAIDQVNYIATLLKKSRTHLTAWHAEPTQSPDVSSAIEEQIGRTWKINELAELQQFEENASLIQLSFNVFDHTARKEFVDEGLWLNLNTGRIFTTLNYRPYRAAKYIQQTNSTAEIHTLDTLYIYPGDVNPRIRWEDQECKTRAAEPNDYTRTLTHAATDYAELIKSVKNSIKNPLADKYPVALIAFHRAALVDDTPVLMDQKGTTLVVKDLKNSEQTTTLLANLLPKTVDNTALVVRCHTDLASATFAVQVLAIVHTDGIIRLIY